jgi:hypothetical protein
MKRPINQSVGGQRWRKRRADRAAPLETITLQLRTSVAEAIRAAVGAGDAPNVGACLFQSVLAGALLGAAAVAEAAGLPATPAGQKAVLNLLRPIGARLFVHIARHGSARCLYQDVDYQSGSPRSGRRPRRRRA